MIELRKQTVALAAGGLVLAAVGAVFLVGAAGGDSGSNSSTDGDITLHASFRPGLAPGHSTTVTYTADNAGDASVFVGRVVPTVSVDGAKGCSPTDFTVTPVTVGTQVMAGATGAFVGTGSLSLAAKKDACANAQVTLSLSD